MTELIKVANWKGERRASVIFVHGLGGHAYETWRQRSNEDFFWPLWLAQDIEGLTVYSLSYAAPASNWVGTAMPLEDRAANVLECILSNSELTQAPVAFICHSLGGLVIKQVLIDADEQKHRRPDVARLLDCVREVVFIATPHTGSNKATWLDRLRFLTWPSTAANSLVANDPGLRRLNVSYREFAYDRRQHIRHQIYYEMQKTAAGTIVDEGSGDAGLPDARPIPIDADHISIGKPLDRDALIYIRIRSFIADLAPPLPTKGDKIQIFPLKSISSTRSPILPILVRVAAIVLVSVFIGGGISYLLRGKSGFVNQTIQVNGNQNTTTQIAITPGRSPSNSSLPKPDILDGKNNHVIRETIK